jgi:hypothetical protein
VQFWWKNYWSWTWKRKIIVSPSVSKLPFRNTFSPKDTTIRLIKTFECERGDYLKYLTWDKCSKYVDCFSNKTGELGIILSFLWSDTPHPFTRTIRHLWTCNRSTWQGITFNHLIFVAFSCRQRAWFSQSAQKWLIDTITILYRASARNYISFS